MTGGSGLNGPEPPARGKRLRESRSRVEGVGYGLTCTPHSPGGVQVMQE